jgi:hypothetical protein
MTLYNALVHEPQQIGPLQVWPLRFNGFSKVSYQVPPAIKDLRFQELDNGNSPQVGFIDIHNPTDNNFLIPEGWIVGADLLQTRMFNATTHVSANAWSFGNVSCIERGRWSPGSNPIEAGRSPMSVSASGWHYNEQRGFWEIDAGNRQSRVWSRVHEQEQRTGERETHSLEQIMREDSVRPTIPAYIQQETARNLMHIPGQNGVLIALDGQVLAMEAFSRGSALRQTLKQTLKAVSFDASNLNLRPIDEVQVHRFIEAAHLDRLIHLSENDWAVLLAGGNECVDTQASGDHFGNLIHVKTINRNHKILQGV